MSHRKSVVISEMFDSGFIKDNFFPVLNLIYDGPEDKLSSELQT